MTTLTTGAVSNATRPLPLSLPATATGYVLPSTVCNYGQGGIRTHETLARPPVFKTGAFNRSATCPGVDIIVTGTTRHRKIARDTLWRHGDADER